MFSFQETVKAPTGFHRLSGEMLGISSDLMVKHDGFMDVSECLGMLLCLRGIGG